MRIFGIDPGSERTGYGCVETDGSRHHIVTCGAITAPPLGMLLAGELHVRRGQRVMCAKLYHDNATRCIFRCGYRPTASTEKG